MILNAEPQLFVTDLPKALEHYGRMGFRTLLVHGEPAFYAQVARDGARLNLRRVDGPVFAEGFRRTEPDALTATLTVDDVAALFEEFVAAAVAMHQPLRSEPWGARTFIVADPDGNLLLFAG